MLAVETKAKETRGICGISIHRHLRIWHSQYRRRMAKSFKDFSIVVWTLGSVVCGYLNETGGRDGRGNNSFFVGRLGKHSTEVAYDSPYAKGRGTASLSLVGGELKWHVIKEIPGGYTPSEEWLGCVPRSGFFNQDDLERDKSQCIEWRPFIESGNIDDLELQEIGGYKHNLR